METSFGCKAITGRETAMMRVRLWPLMAMVTLTSPETILLLPAWNALRLSIRLPEISYGQLLLTVQIRAVEYLSQLRWMIWPTCMLADLSSAAVLPTLQR